MVREGRLLPWNNDVEVCCWANDTSKHKIKAVADDLNLAGYTCFYYSSFGTLNIKKSDKVDININLYWIVDEFAVRPHETASKYQGKNFLASIPVNSPLVDLEQEKMTNDTIIIKKTFFTKILFSLNFEFIKII